MSTWQAALAIAVFVVFDLIVITLVLRAAASSWGPMADRYPPRPPREPNERRGFQSISLGIINLGGCVHITADDQHLHIDPTFFARLINIRPVSIPLAKLKLGDNPAKRRSVSCEVEGGVGTTLNLPAWCVRNLTQPPRGTDA